MPERQPTGDLNARPDAPGTAGAEPDPRTPPAALEEPTVEVARGALAGQGSGEVTVETARVVDSSVPAGTAPADGGTDAGSAASSSGPAGSEAAPAAAPAAGGAAATPSAGTQDPSAPQAVASAAATSGAAGADAAAAEAAGTATAVPTDASAPEPDRAPTASPAQAAGDQPGGPDTAQPDGAAAPVTGPAQGGPAPTPAPEHPTVPVTDNEPTVVLARPAAASSWFVADSDPTQALPSAAVEQDTAPTRGGAEVPRSTPISQAEASADPATERFSLATAAARSTPAAGAPAVAEEKPRRRGRRFALVGGGVLVVLGLLYGADLVVSQGAVPRGVTVAGVPVGGLSFADAEQRLRSEIEPRTTQPIQLHVGEASSTLDPAAAGLAIDWPATLDRVGSQPLNPITRLTSFFGSREVGVASQVDQPKLDAALGEISPIVDKPPVEGSVAFDGVTPVPVRPVAGQKLDPASATTVLRSEWVSGRPVTLPLTPIPPVTTDADVDKAIAVIAKPAVSAPVTITGESGTSATMSPQAIAGSLTFHPDPAGGIIAEVRPDALKDAVGTALAPSEKPGRDATIDFSTGAPVVVPSQDGRGVDYAATATALGPVLIGKGPRQVAATYALQPAELTTEQLTSLGITGLVSEFSTGGFAADSGKNIRRAADQVNGTILKPGETFSLNARTNPRDAAHGYVEAGIIEDGHPSRGVGGGVSQVATTLYNAAYFAGLTLVSHKEHSFYISRYPPGREATVFDDIIDLKFRNDGPTGVMIQTAWTPSALTVRILGTKRYEVTSTTGPRTNPTEPKTVTIPEGQPCSTSKGAPGFTVTDTRTLRDLTTGEVRTEPTRTVRYNPSPVVVCGG